MNFTDPRFWLDSLQWSVVLATAATTWLRRPGEKASQAVTQLTERIDRERNEIVARISSVEERIQHMPTDEEMATLRGDVHAIKAKLEGQGELLKRVEHQTTLIHEHLLRSK